MNEALFPLSVCPLPLNPPPPLPPITQFMLGHLTAYCSGNDGGIESPKIKEGVRRVYVKVRRETAEEQTETNMYSLS